MPTAKTKYLMGLGATPQPSSYDPNLAKPQMVTGLDKYFSGNAGATAPSSPVPSPAKQKYIQSQMPDQGSGGYTPITGNTSTPSGAVVNTETGAMVTPPKSNPMDSYRAAFDSYINSLKPSSEETDARKYLSDLTLQAKRDSEEALSRGETKGFASAENARVNHNNAFDLEAAANSVDALTGNRTATNDANKARLDFEKNLLDDSKPFQTGDTTYQYDPASGEYKSIAAKKPSISEKYGTGSIGEYNFAKDQGYKGSFSDYQNEDANRKAKAAGSGGGSSSGLVDAIIANPGLYSSLTPTAKTRLIPELAARGFDTSRLNLLGLPAAQQEDLTTMATVQDFTNQLLGIANANDGKIAGAAGLGGGSVSSFLFGQFGLGDKAGETNRNLIGQIKGALAKLRGGTSFTPNEQALLETYTPGINDSDEKIVTKLNNLNTFIENKRGNLVGLLGGNLPTGTRGSANAQEGTTSNGLKYTVIQQ